MYMIMITIMIMIRKTTKRPDIETESNQTKSDQTRQKRKKEKITTIKRIVKGSRISVGIFTIFYGNCT